MASENCQVLNVTSATSHEGDSCSNQFPPETASLSSESSNDSNITDISSGGRFHFCFDATCLMLLNQ